MAGKLAKLQSFLRERSLLKDFTAVPEKFHTQDVAAYCGFDPTASSLHLGHLVTLNALAAAAICGIRPIAVIGGGTALIGDPSGKTSLRPKLSQASVASNSALIQSQITEIYTRILARACFPSPPLLTFVNNFDIYKDLSILSFLQDVGYHFPIRPLLAKDMIQSRADGLTYTEFSYQLLQAYDFSWLHKHHSCVLQIGGSDQWGNITTGTELIRKLTGETACGFTLPLVTTDTGEKFGKSEGNALFFDPQLTSPYHIFQYCMNLSDKSISDLLKRLTFKPQAEIESLCSHPPEQRQPQIALGKEILAVLHSETTADAAARLSSILFSRNYEQLTPAEMTLMKQSTVTITVSRSSLQHSLISVLASQGALESRNAGKTLVSQKAIHVNGQLVASADFKLGEVAPIAERFFIVQSGKKRMHLVEITD